jgi:hypothetical protein
MEYLAMSDVAVRQQHDRLARGYDQRWSRYITQTLTFLKSSASIPPQAAVLDMDVEPGSLSG